MEGVKPQVSPRDNVRERVVWIAYDVAFVYLLGYMIDALTKADRNSKRANQWVAQNRAKVADADKVKFTPAELKPHPAFAGLVPDPLEQLRLAWGPQWSGRQWEQSVERVVAGLRAVHGDNFRAREFVDAMNALDDEGKEVERINFDMWELKPKKQ